MLLPPLAAYRHPPNLKYLFVRTRFGPPHLSYHQCGQPRCKICCHMITTCTDTFSSKITGSTFKIKATIDCRTRNVVYVIECPKCRLQYVGETESALHIWMNGHHSDINHWRLKKSVANHFSLLDHSLEDLAIFVIKKIHRDDTHFLRLKKSYWIQALGKFARSELNNNP